MNRACRSLTGVWILLLVAALAGTRADTLTGKPCPEWGAHRWVQGGPLSLSALRGKVVLIRFFTEPTCPFCRETAPALNRLHDELAARGLVVVGMYTPKPHPAPATTQEVRRVVEGYGFRFPVAVDDDWTALRRLWLDRVSGEGFTSASLLVDRAGIVRHVHPGGAYAPDSSDPQLRRDYASLRAAVLALLSEEPGPSIPASSPAE